MLQDIYYFDDFFKTIEIVMFNLVMEIIQLMIMI